MMKTRYSLCALLLVAVSASAQITITQSDVMTLLSSNASFILDSAVAGQTIAIGRASAAEEDFDFSTVMLGTSQVGGSILAAASTPYVDSFVAKPQYAIKLVGSGYTAYGYFDLTANAMRSYGSVLSSGTLPFITRNVPPEPTLQFPCSYGTQWTYQGDSVVANIVTKRITNSTHLIDAFGNVLLPGGAKIPCLREKVITRQTNVTTPKKGARFVQTIYSLTFNYYMQNGLRISVVVDSAAEDLGSTTPKSFSYQHLGTVGVNEPATPAAIALVENYPNPFRDATMLSYTLNEHSVVRIDIVDVLGRITATVFDGMLDAGSYNLSINANQLPAGRYDCRIEANGVVTHHGLNVVR